MTIAIKLTVNGEAHVLEVDDPGMPLLYALRDQLGLHGLHYGCGLAQCGACSLVDQLAAAELPKGFGRG
jgi:nicotinate dehydrogenase subunit A